METDAKVVPEEQRDRFRQLLMLGDVVTEPQEDEPARTQEDQLAFELSGWVGLPEARASFLPYLRKLIQTQKAVQRRVISDHPQLSYALGAEDAFSALEQLFNQLADNS